MAYSMHVEQLKIDFNNVTIMEPDTPPPKKLISQSLPFIKKYSNLEGNLSDHM